MAVFSFRRHGWRVRVLEDIFKLRGRLVPTTERTDLPHDARQLQNHPGRLPPRFPQMSHCSLVQVTQRHLLGILP
jgi:hypothetical protein